MEVGKYALVPEYLKTRGLVKNHIDSYNHFILNRLRAIVVDKVITSEVNPNVHITFKNVYIDNFSMTPQECRLTDHSYSAPIMVVVDFSDGRSTKNARRCIGQMPIMLRSCLCKLHNKSDKELTSLRECALDPGGYFIAKGIEKVMLIQEVPVKNKIMIDRDEKGCIRASVASYTDDKVASKTIIKLENEKFYLELKPFQRKIPIMIVMRAMGMEADQEVVQMIGGTEQFETLLLPSIEECVMLNVHTRSQALNFLESSKMLKMSGVNDRASRILRDVFLPNVPVLDGNFQKKCCHVGVMVRRIMEVILNKDAAMDDKDYVGNKRFVLPGHLLSLLFEDLFKQMSCEARKAIDALLAKGRKLSDFDILKTLGGPIITKGLERTLLTGNWDANRLRLHRTGTTQVVSRFSYIGLLGQMTKIKADYDKSINARELQSSEWGMFCPCDTPVGEACGLEKNLALMTHVTIDEDDCPIKDLCYTMGVEDLEQISPELHASRSYFVILNGLILGKHQRPKKFTDDMRKLRRRGFMGKFVSIILNEKQGCVCIASDGGRVCRPLVIADNGVSKIKEHHMKDLRDGVRDFDSFISDGLIEYLDADEENNSLIALCEKDTTAVTTHIEIEQFTVFGVCAGLIPYPEHNSWLSNVYQCVIGRQAMGNIAYNQLSRMDPSINLLVYPQRPLVTTRTIELVGYDKLGAGQNATVAVMSYSGYDSNNAIVMNKSSLDRGFGRCMVMRRYSTVYQKYMHGWSERRTRPQREGRDAERMQVLDDDGVAAPGKIIRNHDIVIIKGCSKQTGKPAQDPDNVPASAYKSSRQEYKGSEGETTAVLDKVALYADPDGNLCIKVMIRQTRRPEVGDRFSSRHGQKGICGIIVQQEDLPFSERGICPDLIINPHVFPSAMTVGKMMELLGSKAAVSSCKIHLGTAFGKSSGHADTVEAISETLVKHGFSYGGKDLVYSGVTGTPLQSYIFMGPIYYQKSKHMVEDKMRAVAHGKRSMLTREPIRGIRFGEMQRDCVIAYGASSVIQERLMGDHYDALVCEQCGLFGYFDHLRKMNMCSTCRSGERVRTVKMPYSCKLVFQELLSMNIVPRLRLGGLG